MWTFGWNDVVLYAISIIGIILILYLGQMPIRYKRAIIYALFIGFAIVAALASVAIKPDSIGALITRAIVFEAVSIYFLRVPLQGEKVKE